MNNIQEDDWSEDSWSRHSGMPNDDAAEEKQSDTLEVTDSEEMGDKTQSLRGPHETR